MLSENNKIVRMTRGDSGFFTVFINQGTELKPIQYRLSKYDKLYFGLMRPNQPFEHSQIKKVYDENSPVDLCGNVKIEFKPEDTQCLEPGLYYYTIKLRTLKDGEESVNTIVPKTQFYIQE